MSHVVDAVLREVAISHNARIQLLIRLPSKIQVEDTHVHIGVSLSASARVEPSPVQSIVIVVNAPPRDFPDAAHNLAAANTSQSHHSRKFLEQGDLLLGCRFTHVLNS